MTVPSFARGAYLEPRVLPNLLDVLSWDLHRSKFDFTGVA
jgi:hypothetical protein